MNSRSFHSRLYSGFTVVSKSLCLAALVSLAVTALCGKPDKKEPVVLIEKKVHLETLKKRQSELNTTISRLEAEIAELDPEANGMAAAKLVTVVCLEKQAFSHSIDLQGAVTTDNKFSVMPRNGGGQVKAVYVKEGDYIRKGEPVLKLDDAVSLQNLRQVETQLSYARAIFERRKNLWEQDIGTEVNYLTDKNTMETLEKQYQVAWRQWDASNVRSDVSGRVENVTIRIGELFTGASEKGITVVDASGFKAVADVPENYCTDVKKGMPVEVLVPDIDTHYKTCISLVGRVIDERSRTFRVEARICVAPALKPGLLAIVKIRDFYADAVIVVPLAAIQTDEKGKFVFIASGEQERMIARKRYVTPGEVYGERIIVWEGLHEGDLLITQGFQDIYHGQLLTIRAGP